jgi:hypothetical protein
VTSDGPAILPTGPARCDMPDETDVRHLDKDALRVVLKRYREARLAGLSKVEARMWAESEEPTSVLRLCVDAGFTPDQIRQLVL